MGGAGKKGKTCLGRVLLLWVQLPQRHPLSGFCLCLGSVCRESKARAGCAFRHTFPLLLGPWGACKASGRGRHKPCPFRAQSIPHAPPRLEKSSSVTPVTAPMGSGSGVCLDKMCWGTNWTKGQWQTGQGTRQAAWGQLVPLRNPPGLGASPPCSLQMHRHGCRAA